MSEVPRMIGMAFAKDIPSGVYNIQGKETMTVKEIVTLIHKVLGKKFLMVVLALHNVLMLA